MKIKNFICISIIISLSSLQWTMCDSLPLTLIMYWAHKSYHSSSSMAFCKYIVCPSKTQYHLSNRISTCSSFIRSCHTCRQLSLSNRSGTSCSLISSLEILCICLFVCLFIHYSEFKFLFSNCLYKKISSKWVSILFF